MAGSIALPPGVNSAWRTVGAVSYVSGGSAEIELSSIGWMQKASLVIQGTIEVATAALDSVNVDAPDGIVQNLSMEHNGQPHLTTTGQLQAAVSRVLSGAARLPQTLDTPIATYNVYHVIDLGPYYERMFKPQDFGAPLNEIDGTVVKWTWGTETDIVVVGSAAVTITLTASVVQHFRHPMFTRDEDTGAITGVARVQSKLVQRWFKKTYTGSTTEVLTFRDNDAVCAGLIFWSSVSRVPSDAVLVSATVRISTVDVIQSRPILESRWDLFQEIGIDVGVGVGVYLFTTGRDIFIGDFVPMQQNGGVVEAEVTIGTAGDVEIATLWIPRQGWISPDGSPTI